MPSTKMIFDTPKYLKELREYRRVMGFAMLRQAEESLYPIRARKRRLMIRERLELEATIRRRK